MGKIRGTFLPTYKAGLKVGIPCAFLNQGLVPLDLRTSFNDAFSLCWNTYLAIQTDTGGTPAPPCRCTSALISAEDFTRDEDETEEQKEEKEQGEQKERNTRKT